MLIDASGRQSVIARRLGGRWQRWGTTRAIAMLLPGAGDDQSLAVESVEDGWLSLTPRPAGSVLTFYSASHSGAVPRKDARALVEKAVRSSSLIRSRLTGDASAMAYAGTWPAFPRLLATPYGERWFAVGEAAAAYDPISGHGVVFALETAFRGSEMALSESSFATLGPLYQDAIAWRIENHLRRREEIYREAASQYPGSPFWCQFAEPPRTTRPP